MPATGPSLPFRSKTVQAVKRWDDANADREEDGDRSLQVELRMLDPQRDDLPHRMSPARSAQSARWSSSRKEMIKDLSGQEARLESPRIRCPHKIR